MRATNSECLLKAYLIREVERRLLELFSKGHVAGTIHTCLGQELTGIAIAEFLQDHDWVVSNHRCHGHYLARYSDPHALIAEILGKPSGLCKGFGGSQHLYRPGFLSSGIQGGMLPTAVGMAIARRQTGIVVSFIGDGTLGQGIVYETFNFSSLHKVPILFVIENNHYSQSTCQSETLAGTIQKRAEAFGLTYLKSTTSDLDHLMRTAESAIDFVRCESTAAVFEIDTFRLGPHSKGDDFREKEEIRKHEKEDLLNLFLDENTSNLKVQDSLREINQSLDVTVNVILHEEQNIALKINSRSQFELQHEFVEIPSFALAGEQLKELNSELHNQFAANQNFFILGEDVRDPYGGTFKVTQGLSSMYPDRVLNMPISEASVVGVSLGLALAGKTVIAEIMFGDFLSLAFDQLLNHASKFHSMYAEEIPIPLIVRTPMGGGRGYGSTHSQSIEKHFAGIPDLDLFVLHPRANVGELYSKILLNPRRVTLVIENKLLYQRSMRDSLPAGYRMLWNSDPFPVTRLCTDQEPDVTVIAFGGSGLEVEKAVPHLTEDEIYLDIFYPLEISRFAVGPMMASINKTKRLLLVEEGAPGLNLSSQYLVEVFGGLTTAAKSELQFRVITSLNRPIPSAKYLEEQSLPHWKRIRDEVLNLYGR